MKKRRTFCLLVVFCAFAGLIFTHSASAKTIQTATKVIISPASAMVVSGKNQAFTATVYDQNNKKMSGVALTWSLTSTVAGCAVSQTGTLKTTAGVTPLGPHTGLVQAEVKGTSLSAQATVNVLQMPFAGGVFIGTHSCTENCSNGTNESPLAIDAASSSFKAVSIDADDGTAEQFAGTVNKDGEVGAAFTSSSGNKVTILGQITFGPTGLATGVSGTWTANDPSDSSQNESGAFTLSAVPAGSGEGPKIGTWTMPKHTPSSGALYAIFQANGEFVASAASTKGGSLKYTQFPGTWAEGGSVQFSTGGTDVTGGSGSCNAGATSCNGVLDDNSTQVGKWKLGGL